MNEVLLPIPILQEIIDYSGIQDRINFSCTCKFLWSFINKKYFMMYDIPIFGTNYSLKHNLTESHPTEVSHKKYNFVCADIDPITNTLFVSDSKNIKCLDLKTRKIKYEIKFSYEDILPFAKGKECIQKVLTVDSKNRILYFIDDTTSILKKYFIDEKRSEDILNIKDKLRNEHCITDMTLDTLENRLYITDLYYDCIYEVNLHSLKIETLTERTENNTYHHGTPLKIHEFNNLYGIVCDSENRKLYVVESQTRIIKEICLKTNAVTIKVKLDDVNDIKISSSKELFIIRNYKLKGLDLDKTNGVLYVCDHFSSFSQKEEGNGILWKIFLNEKKSPIKYKLMSTDSLLNIVVIPSHEEKTCFTQETSIYGVNNNDIILIKDMNRLKDN